MSLEKKRIQDKIEIVTEFKHIQIRYSDQIIEDGNVISSSYHRDMLPVVKMQKLLNIM
jgi:predicted transcriptional regulator